MNRQAAAIVFRALFPVIPAGILYLAGMATFWGGFLFFLVSEIIRWIWTATHPVQRAFKPLVEFAGILCAPLFTLAILLWLALPLRDPGVQSDLINTFGLYLCYIPYAFVTIFLSPLFER